MWVPYFAVPYVVLINVVCYCFNENSWAWRRLRGARPGWLAVSNRAAVVGPAQRPTSFLAWELIDPQHCVTPLLGPQWLLLALRLLALPYFAIYFVLQGPVNDNLGAWWLKYYTDWSFCLFALSMILGSAATARDMVAQRAQRRAAGEAAARLLPQPGLPRTGSPEADANASVAFVQATPLKEHAGVTTAAAAAAAEEGQQHEGTPCGTRGIGQPGDAPGPPPTAANWTWLAKAHLLTAVVAFPSELFLTLFYWAFLADDDTEGTTVMVHGTNNIFMLADALLSRLPFVSYHYQLLLMYGTVYLVFMWIYYGISGNWVYSSLDWHKSSSAAMYLLLPGFLAICFWFYYGLARLREWLGTRRRTPGAARPPAAPSDIQLTTA